MTEIAAPPHPLEKLTPRERQVAVGLATGLTNHEIAAELGIKLKTIDTHRAHILQKLELRNNVMLCRYMIRHALVTP